MTTATSTATSTATAAANRVHLLGRVSADPQHREMPSGDLLVQFRLVVPRPPERSRRRAAPADGAGSPARAVPGVDTIDVACWSGRTRASAGRLHEGDTVEVDGSLRRRFFATGAGRASRYEVEAQRVRRVRRQEAVPRG